MKKILFFVLMSFTVFALIGCATGAGKTEIEKAFANMDDLESYRMDITMSNIPLVGSMTMTMKYDGDYIYASAVSSYYSQYTYYKVVNGNVYEYIEGENGYTLSTEAESSEDMGDYIDFVDPENFVEEEGKWVYKDDRLYLDDEETEYMEDIMIEISDDGYISSMVFTVSSEGMSFDAEISFSGFNSTSITLPSGIE